MPPDVQIAAGMKTSALHFAFIRSKTINRVPITKETDKTHETGPSPLFLNVKNPEIASSPFCAMLRFSWRWLPCETLPNPWTLGMPFTTPPDDLIGSNALNKVTKVPLGFDRYPTAPRATGAGDHNGRVTNNPDKMSASTLSKKKAMKRTTYTKGDIRATTTSYIDARFLTPQAVRLQAAAIHSLHNPAAPGHLRIGYPVLMWTEMMRDWGSSTE
jgi:hypothetical protein